ncbi:MAG TPA: LamG domain-containing protein, partial [Gammaproteobacteria bacterium]|nr:LamG domain-containing protein [Gammaproteobacteria bacterium]
ATLNHRTWKRSASLAGICLLSLLAGCSGGSGAATQQNAAGPGVPSTGYSGPAPSSPDVQAFKVNVFDNVRTENRCGSCHGLDGVAANQFARSDDVNLAYADANLIVDLLSPADSEMVLQMERDHNCWLDSSDACASIMETWISNWAGVTVGAGGRTIVLEAPASIRPPGESKNFPDDNGALFGQYVYPVLNDANEGNCSRCHSSGSAVQQSPFFAEDPAGDADALVTAYEAAKARMNLDEPVSSRFVERVRDESHNCWTASCSNDAQEIADAIQAFADQIQPDEVDPSLVVSRALTLYEGTIASGGNRHEANVIANYEFKAGTPSPTAFDTSGVDPAMDLTLTGDVEWVGGWGLNFRGGKAQASTASSAKLRDMITATGEYSIEAWVAPGNVVQEDVRIVSYSGSPDSRNFNLGQTMYNYDFFNRNDGVDAALAENGNPQLSTPDAAEVLQATLQHVVATYNPVDGRRIYVNGVLVSMTDAVAGDTLNSWNDTYAFVLGNEVSEDRPFIGVLRMVAIHNRALTDAQIFQNFEAGVGEKFFLLFSVSHLTSVPDSFVVLEGSIFDSYAYLFREPFFISLDPAAQPDGIDIESVRIGLNGGESPVGQAFANLDTTISSAFYDSATGQTLTSLGAVVPLEKGPTADEFFLTFDQFGANTFTRAAPVTPPAPTPVDLPEAAEIGVRMFDEINATMAAITGVSQLEANVSATFNLVRQSLPAVSTIEAVLASHQVAIAQLAIEYCNAAIEDPTARSNLWSASFTGWATSPSGQPAGWELAVAEPLLDRLLGSVTQLETQPDRSLIEAEISQLVNGIPADTNRPGLANTGADTAQRTLNIGKSICSSVLGSAAMLIK